jgi:WD40 repeat protein
VTTLKFVTCSDKDVNSLKIWKFEENPIVSRSKVTLFQKINANSNSVASSVLFVGVVKKLSQTFLLVVESDLFRMKVKFYKVSSQINFNAVPTSGCSITNKGKSIMINQIKIVNDTLFITLPIDEIIKIDINEIIKRFQTYDISNNKTAILLSSRLDNEQVDISLEGSKKNWFSSVSESELITIAGDVSGNIHTKEIAQFKLTKIKTIHKSRIVELIYFKNGDRLISASQDGTLKIWSKDFDFQLGQYNSSNGISILAKIPSPSVNENSEHFNFIFGDQMGNLNLLRWYDE